MRRLACFLLLPWLAGCGSGERDRPVLERVHAGPLEFSVQGEGELRSVRATPLLVPGRQWTPRQLNWMLPDGSPVTKGELVARFSAEQSRQDLAQAQIDLERNLLARATKQAELDDKRGQLGVDLSQVAGQLVIAHRYANAGELAVARNDILDAVQDERYLDVRQQILQSRERQSAQRGKAEMAVLDAQHSTYDTVAAQKRGDLDALELRAPHDGVLVLEKDWSDQVPHVGSSLWAGNSFASLPDMSALEVQLAVPQIEAQGIQVGDAVELHPWGLPAQAVAARLTWVASAAQPRSRDNPVKYLSMKAGVPADVARRYGWMPGQRFVGKVVLLRVDKGLSVPNVALSSSGDDASVQVLADGKLQRRTLRIGVRGATRSQVLDGLREGDQVVLDGGKAAPAAASASPAGAAP
ncbi:hypothetical protein ASG87_11055 [Frateuria sp. Soil773]|uniref:efflux RND transporter periplasmic adaptor subunit n=1 Tax=Frateuria sp. Soil773 TaxID=1736407 RepID=UPI0006FD086C|nr:efflux RND transporter periplasmic adaptor subunit [Frateuria sp. Soil773]KRF02021.1 hypothetical protein ASG87_11055 [Frateuria sp. Soil773]